MRPLRVLVVVFALSLAVAPLVLPIVLALSPGTNGPMIGFGVAVVIAVAIELVAPDVETNDIWTFSVLTFVIAAVLNLLLGTGVNSGEASPIVVIVVWLVGAAVAGAFVARDPLQAALAG